jgi:hypothetical protein
VTALAKVISGGAGARLQETIDFATQVWAIAGVFLIPSEIRITSQ